MMRVEIREKTHGLRPRSGCHGGLPVLPCGAMRGNRDNCSYSITTLFLALIRTYTPMHSVLSRLCFAFSLTLLHSPAVGKVGRPRWVHPLVELVIVGKIGRKEKDWTRLLENSCMLVHSHTH